MPEIVRAYASSETYCLPTCLSAIFQCACMTAVNTATQVMIASCYKITTQVMKAGKVIVLKSVPQFGRREC